MKSSWTRGLNEEQTKEMEREFASSALLRERLIELLEYKIKSNRTTQISKNSYDSPSWAFLQADSNAEERALKYVISLINSKETDN